MIATAGAASGRMATARSVMEMPIIISATVTAWGDAGCCYCTSWHHHYRARLPYSSAPRMVGVRERRLTSFEYHTESRACRFKLPYRLCSHIIYIFSQQAGADCYMLSSYKPVGAIRENTMKSTAYGSSKIIINFIKNADNEARSPLP